MDLKFIMHEVISYDLVITSYESGTELDRFLIRLIGSNRWFSLYALFDDFDEKKFKINYIKDSFNNAIHIYNPRQLDLNNFDSNVPEFCRKAINKNILSYRSSASATSKGSEVDSFLATYANSLFFMNLKTSERKNAFFRPVKKNASNFVKFQTIPLLKGIVAKINALPTGFLNYNGRHNAIYVSLDRLFDKYSFISRSEFIEEAVRLIDASVSRNWHNNLEELPLAVVMAILYKFLKRHMTIPEVAYHYRVFLQSYHILYVEKACYYPAFTLQVLSRELPTFFSFKRPIYSPLAVDLLNANLFYLSDVWATHTNFSDIRGVYHDKYLDKAVRPVLNKCRFSVEAHSLYKANRRYCVKMIPAKGYNKMDGGSVEKIVSSK